MLVKVLDYVAAHDVGRAINPLLLEGQVYGGVIMGLGYALTEEVIHGKRVWEEHACINCHTLHGEGAYFAPEVGNVMTRWGVQDDPEAAFEILQSWMDSQPSGIQGRRQMPQFNLTDEEVRGLAEFLRWADQTDTQGWPPNDAG